jgi:hypothetical protein
MDESDESVATKLNGDESLFEGRYSASKSKFSRPSYIKTGIFTDSPYRLDKAEEASCFSIRPYIPSASRGSARLKRNFMVVKNLNSQKLLKKRSY